MNIELGNEVCAEIEAHKQRVARELAACNIQLKNAKKGEEYSCDIKLPSFIARAVFQKLPDSGLRIEPDTHDKNLFRIHGVPAKAGNIVIAFDYLAKGYRNEVIRKVYFAKKFEIFTQRHELTLTINPDPRDLWKNMPTNRDLPYYKADQASRRIFDGNNELLAASRRGRSHAHSGLPRDDDFALGVFNNWYVLAVADGAGSAKFSRHGSAIACETALRICGESLAAANDLDQLFINAWAGRLPDPLRKAAKKKLYDILPRVVAEARKELRNEASRMNGDMRDYATTLLLAIVKKFPSGWAVGTFQIGDGAMAMFYERGCVKLLAEPDEGEFGGQTRFITMKDTLDSPEDLMRRVNIDFVSNLDGLLLMTDGVSDAKFATLANLRRPQLWLDLWEELGQLARGRSAEADMLEWLQFWSQGNHDDRTIAMLKVAPVLQLSMRASSSVPAVQEIL